MTILPFNTLLCPLDAAPLMTAHGQLTCHHGHCFDIAKRGYINLLPPQFKRSKDPGDSKDMIDARQRFLSNNHYIPLAKRLTHHTLSLQGNLSLLDAGCGEGHYLKYFEDHVEALADTYHCIGLDISKPAIDVAARQSKNIRWIVASNARIPVPSNSLDVIWSVFGFPHGDEFCRVLKPGGRLIQVDAGSEHLIELRRIIYPDIKQKPIAPLLQQPSMTLIHQEQVEHSITLDSQGIHDLLLMTPHLFKTTAEKRQHALNLEHITCTVQMQIRIQAKHGST